MSLRPTSRERATGGFDPFALARDQEFSNMQQGAEVIDSDVGAGWVRVERREGKPLNPAERLTDSIVYDNGAGPGVRIEVRDTRGRP